MTNTNDFKQYNFKRKAFEMLEETAKGYTHKGLRYGYSREIKINDDLSITLNIIPEGNEWVCEVEKMHNDIFRNILNYEVIDKEEFFNCHLSRFDYAMQKLGYKSYKESNKWAYLKSKEEALQEMILQYDYLLVK